jgi:hypothetical protein
MYDSYHVPGHVSQQFYHLSEAESLAGSSQLTWFTDHGQASLRQTAKQMSDDLFHVTIAHDRGFYLCISYLISSSLSKLSNKCFSLIS